MRQLGGRAKALKGASLDARFEQVNPANGDLWVYSSADQLWHNTKVLPEALTLQAALTGTSLTLSGNISAVSATLTGNLNVTGTAAVGTLNAGTINATTLSFASATISGALTIGGALTGSSFSFSGAGTIAGALTVGGALAVTGAISGASLTVTGAISGASLALTGNAYVGGNLTVQGNESVLGALAVGSGLSVDGNAAVTGQLVLGAGGTYTANSIAFLGSGAATITNSGGTAAAPVTTILSLTNVGILQCAGDPNGQLTANAGTLALRTDGGKDRTLYYKATGSGSTGWEPVTDSRSDVEYLYLWLRAITDALASLPQPYQVDVNFDG